MEGEDFHARKQGGRAIRTSPGGSSRVGGTWTMPLGGRKSRIERSNICHELLFIVGSASSLGGLGGLCEGAS